MARFAKLSEAIVNDVIKRATIDREPVTQMAKALGVTPMVLYRHIERRTGSQVGRIGNRRNLNALALKIPTDPALLGYIAGLVDGEGHIQGAVFRTGIYKGREYFSARTHIIVYNTHEPTIRWLHETLGGSFTQRKLRPCPRNKDVMAKPSFEWRVNRSDEVLALLVALLPHLRIKAAKAKEEIEKLKNRLAVEDKRKTRKPYQLALRV